MPWNKLIVIHCFHYIDYKYIAARLRVYPNYAGMFGGKVIDISGPCFPTSPRCRFTDVSVVKCFSKKKLQTERKYSYAYTQ